jgi:beta-lactamase superfamily II metal-dependent hydrolase
MKNILFAAVLLLGAGPQEKGLEVHWIDVEGGAATLVVAPSGESLLMDCGWPGARDADRIKKTAEAAGVKQIDHYLTSHWHTDHWGGVEELAKRLPIKTFYDHGFPGPEAKDVDPKLKEAYLRAGGGKSVVLKPGDSVPLKGAAVKILAAHGIVIGEAPGAPQVRRCQANPEHPAKPEDTSDNARSLAFLLTFGGFTFYDGGDLTWNVEHKLVCPTNLIGKVDVYQSTHHGLSQSNNPALLKAVAPSVVVINCGAKKPGKAFSFRDLKDAPGLKDIFQVHRNVEVGPGDNAPAEFVANDDEKCEGHGVKLTVEPGGKRYTVEVPSKGTRRTYMTR